MANRYQIRISERVNLPSQHFLCGHADECQPLFVLDRWTNEVVCVSLRSRPIRVAIRLPGQFDALAAPASEEKAPRDMIS